MKLLSVIQLYYNVCVILSSYIILLSQTRTAITLLLLLSQIGQAVAGSVISCSMAEEVSAQDCASCVSDANTSLEVKDDLNAQPKTFNLSNNLLNCTQECECCLGVYTFNVFLPSSTLSVIQSSSIRPVLKSPELIGRVESLYRPPITC